jgi:predicted ATPase
MAPHIQGVTVNTYNFPTEEYYPFNLEVIRDTRFINLDTPVTLLVGENGSGKSTFLEALARRCGIHIWRSEHGARYQANQHEKTLHKYMRVDWIDGKVPGSFFGADHFKDFTHLLDDWASTDPGQLKYFGGESLVTKSHGQSIMTFFRSRYAITGLYLLDEPETALSPRSQLELRDLLAEYAESGHAQFVIATHSPILLTVPSAKVYSFDTVPAAPVDFRETTQFQLYRDFFANQLW